MERRSVGPGVTVTTVGARVAGGSAADGAAVEAALARGIRLFATSDSAGDGAAERLLGSVLAGAPDDVVVATTFGEDLYAPRDRKLLPRRPHDWSASYVRYALEASLERLRRETIDLWLMSMPGLDAISSDALWQAALSAKGEGLVLGVGAVLDDPESAPAAVLAPIDLLVVPVDGAGPEPLGPAAAAASERGVAVAADAPRWAPATDALLALPGVAAVILPVAEAALPR